MSAPATNVHGKPLGECEPCGKGDRVLRHGIVAGIETSYCAECAGDELCTACGDDRATCDCLATAEAEIS